MPKFVLEIDCDNASFDPFAGEGVASVLNQVADDVEDATDDEMRRNSVNGKIVYDANGNRVGVWRFTP